LSEVSLRMINIRQFKSHGDGTCDLNQIKKIGQNVVVESGVLIFHPENIEIGNNVYIGHNTFLKGYYKNVLKIGDNTWIGQNCFLHSGGGLIIGNNVGMGPCVKVLTHVHEEPDHLEIPILFCEQIYKTVVIEDDCDIGIGAIILPGITIGRGCLIGAGSVVTKNVEPFSVVAGNPARLLRKRKGLITA